MMEALMTDGLKCPSPYHWEAIQRLWNQYTAEVCESSLFLEPVLETRRGLDT
jgi:hypothetical protein